MNGDMATGGSNYNKRLLGGYFLYCFINLIYDFMRKFGIENSLLSHF